MEIKTQHSPGDKVYFIDWSSKKIRSGSILAIKSYYDGEVSWELDTKIRYQTYQSSTTDSSYNKSPHTHYDVNAIIKDSECFESPEELIEYYKA